MTHAIRPPPAMTPLLLLVACQGGLVVDSGPVDPTPDSETRLATAPWTGGERRLRPTRCRVTAGCRSEWSETAPLPAAGC